MTDPNVTAFSALLHFDATGAATDVTDYTPGNFVPASYFICTDPLPGLGTGIFAIVSKPATPTVTQNPASAAVNAGNSVSFTTTGGANPAPTVQWQVSTDAGATFTSIAGATSTTLTFTAAATDNGDQYRAVFTNSSGTATTSAANPYRQ